MIKFPAGLFLKDHAIKLNRLGKSSENMAMLRRFENVLRIAGNRLLPLLSVMFVVLGVFWTVEARAADLIVICNIIHTDRDAEQYSYQVRFEFFFELSRYRFAENHGSGWGIVSPPQSFERADDDRIVLNISGRGHGLWDEEIDRRTGAYTQIFHTTNGSIAETSHGYCAKSGSTSGRF